MRLLSIKTAVASLLLFATVHADQVNLSQLYSQLQGTHWAGKFDVNQI